MGQTARRDGLFHTQPKVLEEEASLTVVHTHLYIRPSALDLLRWLFYIYTGSLSLSRLSYRGDGSIVGWSAAVFDTHPSVRCPVRSSSSPTAVKLTPDFQKDIAECFIYNTSHSSRFVLHYHFWVSKIWTGDARWARTCATTYRESIALSFRDICQSNCEHDDLLTSSPTVLLASRFHRLCCK